MSQDANLNKYISKQAIFEVLGCFIKKPSLMKIYKAATEDFVENFYQIIFAAISNLYTNGIEEIDISVINNFLVEYPIQYNIFEKNKGTEFLESIILNAELENIEYYFTLLKKFTLLRRLQGNGILAKDFFDPFEVNPKEIEKKRNFLDNTTIENIINHFRAKQLEAISPFTIRGERESKKAGVGGLDQLEKWKSGTNWGIGYSSAYLTTISQGMRKGHLVIRSAPSGVGKTRGSIADICHSCSPYYFNKKENKWCKNPNGTQNKVLYIGTEMKLLEEIEPIMYAYIADVPQHHITKGTYDEGEEERVKEAVRILSEKSNIWLEYMPEFNINKLENLIESHKVLHGIDYVFFDYIQSTPELVSEYVSSSSNKMSIREDQVLRNFSTKLKSMAETYDVYIDTYTQVSGDFKNENNRDETIIAGAKAIITKADLAAIVMRPTKTELKKIEPIIQMRFNQETPNLVYNIYKNRDGEFNLVKIWVKIDYSTMRVHDLFVTDYDFDPQAESIMGLRKTYIEFSEEEEKKIMSETPTTITIEDMW